MPGDTMNPFDTVPVESDKHFIGRHRETSLIERVIAEGKRPPHRVKGFLITGEEGVGKTSLMLHLQRIAKRERYLIVSTNAAEHKQHNPLVSYLWDLLRQLIMQTEQLGSSDDPSASADVFEGIPDFSLYKAALRGLPLEMAQLQTLTQFEFPSWYYAYVHNPHSEVGASPLVPWINDVQNILRLAESRAGVPGCFMALDNVEALSAEDVRVLLDAVRAVYEALGGCGVSFVLSGAPSLRRHAQRQRAVANIFHDLRLSGWNSDEVAEYVRRPELQERGLLILDEDVQRFLDDTEGSPAILSMLCSYIFDACTSNEQQRFEPSESVIERVITELEGVSSPHVIDRIKRAPSRELEGLTAYPESDNA